jgi:hypothetical protein
MAKKKDKNLGGAPKENKNGLALKDPDVRQEAYEDYCAHLSEGRGKRGWCYNKDGLNCTFETMEKYIKNEVEFDPQKKRDAEAKGYMTWESVVMDSAKGKNKEANTATLQMLMRNKYGWDKPEQAEERHESTALVAVEAFVMQLKGLQSSSSIDTRSNPND